MNLPRLFKSTGFQSILIRPDGPFNAQLENSRYIEKEGQIWDDLESVFFNINKTEDSGSRGSACSLDSSNRRPVVNT
jgi:hypothetical protein